MAGAAPVGAEVEEGGGGQFDEQGGEDVCEEDCAFGQGMAGEIGRGREDDHIEDVVDEAKDEKGSGGRGECEGAEGREAEGAE
ncbi:hypothetical protein NEOLI_004205 [Neolecta irregularis DAH-3]|uniref:Uncharacterized protein n=1 Tax=Neolecta irregularis (strain DAH-3) TaxID=1198029 RepID=A0A1U7LTE9_NEOID|nr:hypothetical protein NEOLI_004205 [Neolecta irregularis DAH-3]|eukprot:OLL25946.1 hypothetical protein NEOLI_004205 [Neolecta irregularis DAH-3]